MFFNVYAIIYSLFLGAGLEFLAFRPNFFFYVIPFMILLPLWAVRETEKIGAFGVIGIFLSFFSMSLLYFIDIPLGKQIFILVSSFIFYLSLLGFYRIHEYEKDKTAKALIISGSHTAIFLFYSTVYGVYLNFIIPLWVLMVLFLVATSVISYYSLELVNDSKKNNIWVYSLLLGFMLAEFAWVINFWPFGYLVTGVITLVFYYLLWDLVQGYFLNILSKRRTLANMVLFFVLVSVVLMTSKWLPLA